VKTVLDIGTYATETPKIRLVRSLLTWPG